MVSRIHVRMVVAALGLLVVAMAPFAFASFVSHQHVPAASQPDVHGTPSGLGRLQLGNDLLLGWAGLTVVALVLAVSLATVVRRRATA